MRRQARAAPTSASGARARSRREPAPQAHFGAIEVRRAPRIEPWAISAIPTRITISLGITGIGYARHAGGDDDEATHVEGDVQRLRRGGRAGAGARTGAGSARPGAALLEFAKSLLRIHGRAVCVGAAFWRYLPPHDRTQPRGAAPPHLRHHFPPRRRQDHADRKAAAVLGRDPDRRLGEGAQGSRHATSDWMEIEKQRGISVACSVMQMEYRGAVINLLDTPGHQDFSEDTYRVLTAVDAALMVIDAANGVEPQTRRLLQVCRARNTPILTFVNKMDREVREPLALMDEIERELGMSVVPFTWPVGMGKRFHGVFDLRARADARVRARARTATAATDDEILAGLDNPAYARALRRRVRARRKRHRAAAATPRRRSTRARSSPASRRRCSSARRSTTSACAKCSTRWSTWRRRRASASRCSARSHPDEPKFSGVVFKIQANMDPAHRDRVAFVRVALGPLRARHAAEGRALGQGAAPQHGGELPVAAPRAARRGVRRRHHRHSEPRRAAARRHADRRRAAAVHRAAVLRAGDVPRGRGRRPAAHQAAARRPDAARRGRRDPGVPAGRRIGAAARRGRPAAVRGGRAPARARVRRQGAHPAEPLPGRALGHLRAGRRRRRELQRFIDANQHRVAYDAVDAPTVLVEYAPELRAIEANWPKIRFHALREHAGLVFQKQLEG